ncbi:ferredoxin [Methanobrevibacter cuticularis]|uniref:Ferredoxin n=1 Tax=Methanobrevibacter cuticularis TaxID=47311 RepID=A0A166DDR8_9EURY|nr:4Fe-4S dicluster domain-containing protein [Methanobrevibacter cuticularis]KZX15483.1 ferredoxin [Methanobrevibacter cuticularis]
MKIDLFECAICEACVDVCPLDLIKKKAYKIIIQDGCDNCGECLEVCPVGAIHHDDED